MPDTWITKMIHFDYKDDEDIPARVKKIAGYFGSIVTQSLKNPSGIESNTGIQCRRRPGRIPCTGVIRSTLFEDVLEIKWYCLVCGDEGRITEWEGTRWDKSLIFIKIIRMWSMPSGFLILKVLNLLMWIKKSRN